MLYKHRDLSLYILDIFGRILPIIMTFYKKYPIIVL